MRHLFLGSVFVVVLAAGVAACGDASDPNVLRSGAPQTSQGGDGTGAAPGTDGTTTDGTTTPTSDGTPSGGSSGPTTPPPAGDGGTTPPPSNDPFAGAAAFASQVAGSTHNAGQNCMGGCHNHGFTFAGTVTDGAGAGVAGAEVRLVDANGKAISVYTGSNGNFHSSTAFVAPAHIGVRNASAKSVMVTALQATNGGCNGCHGTGLTVAAIHVP